MKLTKSPGKDWFLLGPGNGIQSRLAPDEPGIKYGDAIDWTECPTGGFRSLGMYHEFWYAIPVTCIVERHPLALKLAPWLKDMRIKVNVPYNTDHLPNPESFVHAIHPKGYWTGFQIHHVNLEKESSIYPYLHQPIGTTLTPPTLLFL